MVVGSILGMGAKAAGKGLGKGAAHWKGLDANTREWATYVGNVLGSVVSTDLFNRYSGSTFSLAKLADYAIDRASGRDQYESRRTRNVERAEARATAIRDATTRTALEEYTNRRITAADRDAEIERITDRYEADINRAHADPGFTYPNAARGAYAATSLAKAGALGLFALPKAYAIANNLSNAGVLSMLGPTEWDLMATVPLGALLWYGGKSLIRGVKIAATGRD